MAWTPDVAGRRVGPWLGRPAFTRLWGNILSWILPPQGSGRLRVEAEAAERPGSVELPAAPNGARIIQIQVDDAGEWRETLQLTGVVVSYPDEYRHTGVDRASLQALARAGGGALIHDPAEFPHKLERAGTWAQA